jgi:hypothetical protein
MRSDEGLSEIYKQFLVLRGRTSCRSRKKIMERFFFYTCLESPNDSPGNTVGPIWSRFFGVPRAGQERVSSWKCY